MKIEFIDQDPAIQYLKRILTVDQFNQFLQLADRPEISLSPATDEFISPSMFSARLRYFLEGNKLTTIRSIALFDRYDPYYGEFGVKKMLQYTPNIGQKSIKELEQHLSDRGWSFERLDQIRFGS